MQCPFCKNKTTKVTETRSFDNGFSIRRRRVCDKCGKRFTTVESVPLTVVKRDGVTREPFDRSKVINGVRKACQGRPINEADMKKLGAQVEMSLRSMGRPEIPSSEIGKAILVPLRDLDFVTYLRFASVYQEFKSLDDFKKVIEDLERYSESKNRPDDNAPASTEANV